MPRIACLFAPCFPLAARLRAEPELGGQAVVICRGNGTAARVVAVSRAAWRFGLRPGTTLAQARSRLPDIIARSRDMIAERSTHEALLEAASTLSPRVEEAGEDMIFADVAGMGALFPGEDGENEIGRMAMLAAEGLSLIVQTGIAGTKLAARVAAGMPHSPTVIPAGEEAAFLAPLPLTQLALPRRIRETLQRWGVRTTGELARLPADRVTARLGPSGEAAHRAARGEDPEPLAPHHPPPILTEGLELEWPVITVDPLLAALRLCLERTHHRLEYQDLVCILLELELVFEPEGTDRRLIRLPAPARDVEALLTLTRLEIEAHPPEGPVTAFRCLIHPDRPRSAQLTLFGAPEIHPDRLAVTLARLAARLGPDRVGSPRIVYGHLPERATTVPFDPPPPPKSRRVPRRGRGLLAIRVLRPPVALEVIVEESCQLVEKSRNRRGPSTVGAGPCARPSQVNNVERAREPVHLPPSPPHSFVSQRPVSVASENGAEPHIQGLVHVAAGPWSLEEGWWKEEPIAREYWDVELSGGGLYRIYRDCASGDWFGDGVYD
ncbi:MAG: DNA polymerase Y family protein [Thermoanaerobaculales bacterium]|nr:DNA polymerase Y family protein [Thermoanaerobaculales bacterium]